MSAKKLKDPKTKENNSVSKEPSKQVEDSFLNKQLDIVEYTKTELLEKEEDSPIPEKHNQTTPTPTRTPTPGLQKQQTPIESQAPPQEEPSADTIQEEEIKQSEPLNENNDNKEDNENKEEIENAVVTESKDQEESIEDNVQLNNNTQPSTRKEGFNDLNPSKEQARTALINQLNKNMKLLQNIKKLNEVESNVGGKEDRNLKQELETLKKQKTLQKPISESIDEFLCCKKKVIVRGDAKEQQQKRTEYLKKQEKPVDHKPKSNRTKKQTPLTFNANESLRAQHCPHMERGFFPEKKITNMKNKRSPESIQALEKSQDFTLLNKLTEASVIFLPEYDNEITNKFPAIVHRARNLKNFKSLKENHHFNMQSQSVTPSFKKRGRQVRGESKKHERVTDRYRYGKDQVFSNFERSQNISPYDNEQYVALGQETVNKLSFADYFKQEALFPPDLSSTPEELQSQFTKHQQFYNPEDGKYDNSANKNFFQDREAAKSNLQEFENSISKKYDSAPQNIRLEDEDLENTPADQVTFSKPNKNVFITSTNEEGEANPPPELPNFPQNSKNSKNTKSTELTNLKLASKQSTSQNPPSGPSRFYPDPRYWLKLAAVMAEKKHVDYLKDHKSLIRRNVAKLEDRYHEKLSPIAIDKHKFSPPVFKKVFKPKTISAMNNKKINFELFEPKDASLSPANLMKALEKANDDTERQIMKEKNTGYLDYEIQQQCDFHNKLFQASSVPQNKKINHFLATEFRGISGSVPEDGICSNSFEIDFAKNKFNLNRNEKGRRLNKLELTQKHRNLKNPLIPALNISNLQNDTEIWITQKKRFPILKPIKRLYE